MVLKSDGDLQKIISYTIDILEALIYLHENGIIHMDIKPGNLLAEAREDENRFKRVKLCDFGLSRFIGNDGGLILPLRCGSESYIAPEVNNGGWVTPAADMWSLGIFVYILTFGYSPFILGWDPSLPLPTYPRHWNKYQGTGLYSFLSACLQFDPSSRLTSRGARAHWFINGRV